VPEFGRRDLDPVAGPASFLVDRFQRSRYRAIRGGGTFGDIGDLLTRPVAGIRWLVRRLSRRP
jgi:hypothetical protein